MFFVHPNPEIGQKMANGQLLLQALSYIHYCSMIQLTCVCAYAYICTYLQNCSAYLMCTLYLYIIMYVCTYAILIHT